ncbi:GNAT family N-acetyltransferase [Mycoplasmatota bacterium]|nr:GNAT family N-acetyltransferase [Mycoplasmatota bacterium]
MEESILTDRLEIIPCDMKMILEILNCKYDNIIFSRSISSEQLNKLRTIANIFKEKLSDDKGSYRWFAWIVAEKETGHIVGDVGFKGAPNELGDVEIGFGIDSAFRRRGYATEAALALMKWAFHTGIVERIFAICRIDNLPSIKVLENIGMIQNRIHDSYVHWSKII